MANPAIGGTPSETRFGVGRLICLFCTSMLFLTTLIPLTSQAQMQQRAKPPGAEPDNRQTPCPARHGYSTPVYVNR
jgi:hypothetical protein